MNARADAVAELEARLGRRFSDAALLERALTHSSVSQGARPVSDNERLEFLGDRVLGLLAAEYLVGRYPDSSEGELSPRLHAIVDGQACARVARRLGIGEAMRVAAGETKRGARNQDTLLSDACEALIAALYLEAGLDAVREVWLRIWKEELESPLDPRAHNTKSALQEWAAARGKPLPVYQVTNREGPDHAPQFTCEVQVVGLEPAQGAGPSRQAAEKAAALALMTREGAV